VCPVGNLAVTGYGDATKISVSGSNDLSLISASIQATVDPSGQQLNGIFGMSEGFGLHQVCPGINAAIALQKQ
jgi:hypothetical protein